MHEILAFLYTQLLLPCLQMISDIHVAEGRPLERSLPDTSKPECSQSWDIGTPEAQLDDSVVFPENVCGMVQILRT